MTCSVVANKGEKITKAVRSSLQVKVTSESGAEIMCREQTLGESCFLFTFPAAPNDEEGYEVVAMLASLHLPGSPLFVPPFSQMKTITSELGILFKDSNSTGKDFETLGRAPELTEVISPRKTRVKVEGNTDGKVEKLSSLKEVLSKEVSKGKLRGPHQEPTLKVEEGLNPEVNKSSQLKEVVKEKCWEEGVQAVAQLRRPAERSTDGSSSQADTKLKVGVSCYLLEEDTKMWHAGSVHNVLNGLIVVKNLDNQKFTGCRRDQLVLRIEDIPEGATCADSAKKTASKKEEKIASEKEEKTTEKKEKGKPGEKCVARWREDLVWYRAEILTITPTFNTVRFVDYGNEADVRDCDIVSSGWEVPKEDILGGLVDYNVVLEKEEESEARLDETAGWSRGETCLARWEVDGVWYRAEVVEATYEGSTRVLFLDYGNQDDATALVRTTAELSEDDVRDVHVDCVEDLSSQQPFQGDDAQPVEPVFEEIDETGLEGVDISELACCVCGELKKVCL